MNRSISWLLASAVAVAPAVTAVATYSATAEAQVVVYPPASYIAAYSPYYYNGYPHYFYRNHWYYRDHVGWHGYATEPGALYGYRGNWAHHRYGWR
jgi:hypothetical protein